ncbi:hypothetical protein [Amycolatopsis nigrescens]|uniref:hypothetical protein n=1 Tax=Amycolatopsis nigrescens TaxID=381445 RepID=UPI000381E8BF|nr:hypothetical protein [Amycolatopsis nigrescens]
MSTRYDLMPYLDALREHLKRHDLPAPVGVQVTTWKEPVAVELHEVTVAEVARALLAWSSTLAGATLTVWRPPNGLSVYLTIVGRLPGGIPVHVWGSVSYTFNRKLFPDLPADTEQDASVAMLRHWVRAGEGAA